MKKLHITHLTPSLAVVATASALLLVGACVTDPYYATHRPQQVVATVGTSVTTLPRGYETVDVDGRSYYYHGGNYYRRNGSRYVSTERPLHYPTNTRRGPRRHTRYGVVHDTLPSRYQTVRYRNRDYYYNDGVYFEPRGSRYHTTHDPFRY